jgi:RHS repeat-associated protein
VGSLGYYFDSESGLHLLTHRYLDVSVGRFVSWDPIKEGVNWYGYVGNRSPNRVDPLGLASCEHYYMRCLHDADETFSDCMAGMGIILSDCISGCLKVFFGISTAHTLVDSLVLFIKHVHSLGISKVRKVLRQGIKRILRPLARQKPWLLAGAVACVLGCALMGIIGMNDCTDIYTNALDRCDRMYEACQQREMAREENASEDHPGPSQGSGVGHAMPPF